MQYKKENIPLNERIIFPLDVDTHEKAEEWVKRLESHINFFKVGLELFMTGWQPVTKMITDRGHKVMCDIKMFDVPETIKSALKLLKNNNVTFVTVHGNDSMLKAAVSEKNGVKILSVTVLTSLGDEDMKDLGFECSIEELVYKRAKRALDIGCDGVISSGLEVPKLRKDLGDKFIVVTPGIRPGGNIEDDQVRIVTPKDAIKSGADHVVIGRPIRNANDPIKVVESIQKEIQEGLNEIALV